MVSHTSLAFRIHFNAPSIFIGFFLRCISINLNTIIKIRHGNSSYSFIYYPVIRFARSSRVSSTTFAATDEEGVDSTLEFSDPFFCSFF